LCCWAIKKFNEALEKANEGLAIEAEKYYLSQRQIHGA